MVTGNLGDHFADRKIKFVRQSCERLFSKKSINSFMVKTILGSTDSVVSLNYQNFLIEDMHLQNTDICLANYFIDCFYRKCFVKYRSGYWPIYLNSLTLTCAYPEIDNQKLAFSSNQLLLKVLNSTSSVFVKRNSRRLSLRLGRLDSDIRELSAEPNEE